MGRIVGMSVICSLTENAMKDGWMDVWIPTCNSSNVLKSEWLNKQRQYPYHGIPLNNEKELTLTYATTLMTLEGMMLNIKNSLQNITCHIILFI